MSNLLLIDSELWQKTRAGARAGRGFRYQDAVGALLAIEAWSGDEAWSAVIPEGVDDITLHGHVCEIRAQLKSRHDPQGIFSLTEAASYLAKSARDLPANWMFEGRIRLALVFERPVVGLTPTGWRISLHDSGQPLDPFITALEQAMETSSDIVKTLLKRTHLVVEQEPLERAIPRLEAQANLAPAAARLVLQQLREVAGQAADENFLASANHPVSLGSSDVQERIDAVSGVVDPAGYLTLTGGLCDIANFGESLASADFYSGVNVMPGHVGAGLVFERPEHTTEILEALESRRAALVAGPSGAGKSALAWLAAYHTRHAVRWYRVRRVGPEDVSRLVQLARILDARPERPVGFMVDDVGHEETAGWDALVRETEVLAGLLLLGSVREEDVFTLSTAARVPIIRPTLDEELAERIWKALSSKSETTFGHWREPFELSRGLLLEYTHLLTEGRRLFETVHEQIRRRLAEGRDDELLILQPVAFAAAHGCTIDQVRLRNRLGWGTPRFARALNRLIHEHAIRQQDDGTLAGLHEIRSIYLEEAIREVLGDSVNVAVSDAVHGLCADDFATFIVRVLRRWPDQQAALMDALTRRVSEEGPSCWAPILHGLGLATADLVAARWVTISRETGIDDRLASFSLGLAIAGSNLSDVPFFSRLTQAQEKFAHVAVKDLRCRLIEHLHVPKDAPLFDLGAYHELIAALLPLARCAERPSISLSFNQDLSAVPLIPLLEVIRTAYELAPENAQSLIDAAGGSEVLLERLYYELPWVTRPRLSEQDGVPIVAGDVRYISDEIQPDIHGDVVRFCELQLAAAPNARLVVSNAVFPDGRPVGFGDHEIATKRIPRENLPAPARVAWTRAQLRAVQRLVGASRETDRTTALAQAIEDFATKLQEAGDYFCRMEQPKEKWRLQILLHGLSTDYVSPPPVAEVVPNALAQGEYAGNDEIHTFVSGIQRLIGELTDGVSEKPGLMAARTADLANSSEKIAASSIWRLATKAPFEALRQIHETLWNIRAVLGDTANEPQRRQSAALRFSRGSRRYPTLPRAAQEARARAEADVAERRKAFEAAFEAAGLRVHVYSKPAIADSGYVWPDVEYAGLLAVDSVVDWFTGLESFREVVQSLPHCYRFSYAPLINDLIPPFAVVFIQSVLPHADFQKEWSAHLPYAFIEDDALAQFTSSLQALIALSAIFGGHGRPLNEEEEAYGSILLTRFSTHVQWFSSGLDENQDEQLVEAVGFLLRCFERVQSEFEDPMKGDSLAAEAMKFTDGTMTDFSLEQTLCRITLAERAITGSN